MTAVKPLLLDTHYWIWMESGATGHFSKAAMRAVEEADKAGALLLSVISIWELGMLEAKGRVRLDAPCQAWVAEALNSGSISLAPLTPEIALASSRLPGGFEGDPADCIIPATARQLGARLLTRDRNLLD